MNTRARLFALAVLILAVDRASKAMVEAYVSAWETVAVVPGFFNIVLSKNSGAIFGFLAEQDSRWRIAVLIGLSGAVTLTVAWLLWQATMAKAAESGLMRLALALVLGGALGNMFDRVRYGVVTDFLDFYIGSYHWHTFNVADAGITVGACLLALDLWRTQGKTGKA